MRYEWMCLVVMLALQCRAGVVDGYLEALDAGAGNTNRSVVVRLAQDERKDCELRVSLENWSVYPFVFGSLQRASGYDSLEFDVLTTSGKVYVVKKRMLEYISDLPVGNMVPSGRRWVYSVDLKDRSWMVPYELRNHVATHIRVRFAFGAYYESGKPILVSWN